MPWFSRLFVCLCVYLFVSVFVCLCVCICLSVFVVVWSDGQWRPVSVSWWRGQFRRVYKFVTELFDSWSFRLVSCHISQLTAHHYTGRRSLRSTDSNRMVVPSVRLSIVANRAFLVVGPQIWNDLPAEVTSAESLTTFCQRLKTHLFWKSFPGYLLDIN